MKRAALPAEAPDPAPVESSLATITDLDELEQVEERILASRLAGEESVAAYLYCILPDEQNRIPKPIVGPTADFVVQLVRRINQASRGRVRLKLLPEPPVVTDFSVPDDRGRPVPYVRVIVGAVDEATGEVVYGIKETRRTGKDPVSVAHTRAIRRALELHPSYNRKVVGKFIREKLRELGYDPAKFIVQAGSTGGEWGKFFAMARAKGVDPQQLRQAVRDQMGKGLSEVATAQEVDVAAATLHETLQRPQEPPQPVSAPASVPEDRPGGEQVHSADPLPPDPVGVQTSAKTSNGDSSGATPSVASAPVPEYPGKTDAEAIVHLRSTCEQYVKQIGLLPETVARLWKKIKPAGDPADLAVQRLRYRRFFALLYALSIGEKEQTALRSALDHFPDPVPTASAAG